MCLKSWREGEGSYPLGSYCFVPVDEDVLLAGVAVQVAEEHQAAGACHAVDEALEEVDRWVALAAGGGPAAVEVAAGQRAAVVPVDHAVGVQHRHALRADGGKDI